MQSDQGRVGVQGGLLPSSCEEGFVVLHTEPVVPAWPSVDRFAVSLSAVAAPLQQPGSLPTQGPAGEGRTLNKLRPILHPDFIYWSRAEFSLTVVNYT